MITHFEGVDEKTATNSALEFAEYLTQFAKSKSDLSDSERAKSYIIDWFNQHEMKFLSTNVDNVKIIRDVYGYYQLNSNIPLINPSILRKALQEAGFSPNKIFAEWHDEGVISYDEKSKQYSYPFTCNDGKQRRLTKLDFLIDGDPTPSNGGDSTPLNDGGDSNPSNDGDVPTPSNVGDSEDALKRGVITDNELPPDDSKPDGGYSSDEDPFPKS